MVLTDTPTQFPEIPKLKSFMTLEQDDKQFEGEMMRKVESKKGAEMNLFKARYYRLIGKELYVYKKKDSKTDYTMYSLVGVFLKDADNELFED